MSFYTNRRGRRLGFKEAFIPVGGMQIIYKNVCKKCIHHRRVGQIVDSEMETIKTVRACELMRNPDDLANCTDFIKRPWWQFWK